MRESERKMSETGQDAAGRNYSAINSVAGTQQRVLSRPCPQAGGQAFLVPPLSSPEIAPCLLHSHPGLQHPVKQNVVAVMADASTEGRLGVSMVLPASG